MWFSSYLSTIRECCLQFINSQFSRYLAHKLQFHLLNFWCASLDRRNLVHSQLTSPSLKFMKCHLIRIHDLLLSNQPISSLSDSRIAALDRETVAFWFSNSLLFDSQIVVLVSQIAALDKKIHDLGIEIGVWQIEFQLGSVGLWAKCSTEVELTNMSYYLRWTSQHYCLGWAHWEHHQEWAIHMELDCRIPM